MNLVCDFVMIKWVYVIRLVRPAICVVMSLLRQYTDYIKLYID